MVRKVYHEPRECIDNIKMDIPQDGSIENVKMAASPTMNLRIWNRKKDTSSSERQHRIIV